jgi:heme-degrading monooxygenase HmoA
MGELVAIRVRVHELDAGHLVSYFEDASRRASTTDGFLGGRLYRLTTDGSDHLIVWHYRDVAAAERGLVEVAKTKSLGERQSAGHAPADVTRARVLHAGGLGKDSLPEGHFLSLSVRVADPGYGKELASEYQRIFTELQFIPGFRGYIIAVNDTLDEEIYGIVTWDSAEAFGASLPAGVLYEVKLYGLVATSSAAGATR